MNPRPRPAVLTRRDLFRSGANFFAFGFGAGLSRIAPGTCGSAVALALLWGLQGLGEWVHLGAVIAAAVGGVFICEHAARTLNPKTHDHPGIVWDEIVGLWVALLFLPFSIQTALLGFALFRFFDIVKPFPIGYLDRRISGGLGVMVDDIVAGLCANLVLRLLVPYLPLG